MLNYDIHPLTNKLLDSLSSHYFLPHMLQPTRGASNSKVLTDYIFTNISVPNIILGNITASIQTTFHSFLIFLSILLITVPINRKDTGQDLINKILFLIIFWLNIIIFCLHQTWKLIIHIKLSLKSLYLYLTNMRL